MRWIPKEKGFHETDRSLEEYVDGFEIAFFYDGKVYRTGGSPDGHFAVINTETEKMVLETDCDEVQEFLETKLQGKTMREILEKEAYFLGLC